jgi:hypothetical protein
MTFLFSKTERYLLNLLKECKLAKRKISFKKRHLVLAVSGFIIFMFFIVSFSGMAMLTNVQANSFFTGNAQINDIPSSILQDARSLATELYGQNSGAELYFQQLISAYKSSEDKNVLIIFNPGGWGTKSLEESSDWMSIINGMQKELGSAGFKVVALNYQRTTNDLRGQIHELEEIISGYYSKSNDLSKRVEFLTQHIRELKVILAGESTGTMICDSTMNLLKDNERVFSIQTGSPFWQKNTIRDRTIVVNDNGVIPDTFSRGDFFTVIKSSLQSLLGNKQPEDQGKILNVLSAPGHEYWWQNPKVFSQIGYFLEEYFGVQSKLQDNK